MTLPYDRDELPLAAPYDYLNHPDRHSTPAVTIDAIDYAVRQGGAAAVREPDTAERLSRCDDDA